MNIISLALVLFWAVNLGYALSDHNGWMIFTSGAALFLVCLLHGALMEKKP